VSADRLHAEQRARVLIDAQLTGAGWHICDVADLDLVHHPASAVREVRMKRGSGQVDYLLYVDRMIVGVIEAKPEGTTLSGVEWQSAMYADGLSAQQELMAVTVGGRLPFVFEASGSETHFTNGYDPDPRARTVFAFPQPATLARTVREAKADPAAPTWRGKVRQMPELDERGLRPAQIDAIKAIERSLAEARHDRSLVQMATGAGKTFAAVTESYRLVKWGGFNRVLFLLDRNNLGDQTLREFRDYTTPDDGRKFTELYNVDKLTGAGMVASSKVVISTIQRVYAALRGEEVPDVDDPGIDNAVPDQPVEVGYDPQLPPEAFDLIIVDECHRSIYGVWRGVLEYFDGHLIGLTATPTKQTFGFFRQNLVAEYTYAESVADKVNVDFDVYRIKTQITERSSSVEAGTTVPVRDKRTRRQRYESLTEDLDYAPGQLDRAVTATNQIRLVLETFRDRLTTEIFPGRTAVPKTLIFAKDDNHAEEIVNAIRDVFGKGNDFAAKITYNARDPRRLLQDFRNSPTLRVAVTVDMIATGTDVKPLECVFFMRDVRSATYFEQMKGRGARTIPDADFQAVTPDSKTKDRFVIVDAIGVTEHEFIDAAPLNRDRSATLQLLLNAAAALTITEDQAATLAARLARLDHQLTAAEQAELAALADGATLTSIVKSLVDAVDPDTQVHAADAARERDEEATPADAIRELIVGAVAPIAGNPALRARIIEIRASHDLYIDDISQDELLDAHGVVDTTGARQLVDSWRDYLDSHKDEITALQVLYDGSSTAKVTYAELRELAERIKRPPHNWTPDLLWNAYAAIEVDPTHPRVRRADHHTVTDLLALIRYTLGMDSELVPYADTVAERYAAWLLQQEQSGAQFTDRQRWWLDRIADTIAQAAGMTAEDLDKPPFTERGGIDGALADLGSQTAHLISELGQELTA
jgi:type I restriction enzyme R subunit